MKKSKTSWMAIAVSGLVALSAALPADAMPVPTRVGPMATDSQNVRMDRDQRIWHKRGFNRSRVTSHRHVSTRYRSWRGYRGYRYHRPGYRRYDGFWYPPAAFSIGVVVRPGIRRGNAHVRWCRNHYVSYQASDNTFQPYEGSRRQCVSPYSR
jgi:hypothetical protein